MHQVKERRYFYLFLSVVALYTILFTAVAAWRYRHFIHDGSGDLLLFEQVIYNTGHGRPFFNNFSDANHFGDHNSPMLALLVPFSYLVPVPYVLFFFTVLAVSSSSVGIYLIAAEVLESEILALSLSLCYLAVPAFVNLAYQSFHEINLVLPFLTFAFYFFIREKFYPFLAMFVLALLVKEDVAITLFMFAPYALLKRRSMRWVITPAAVSVAWFLLSVRVVIPFFNKSHGYGVGLGYFSNLGNSLSDIVINTFTKPDKTLQILLQPNNLIYLMALLVPVGLFLPFASVESLFAVPSVVFNLLANSGRFKYMTYTIGGSIFNVPRHMSLLATVFLFIGAIYGIRRIGRAFGEDRLKAALGVVAAMVLLLAFSDRFILSKYAYKYYPEVIRYPFPESSIRAALPLIPATATVKANICIANHLYDRKDVYYNLDNPKDADFLVVTTGDLGVTDPLALKEKYDPVTSDEHFALLRRKGYSPPVP